MKKTGSSLLIFLLLFSTKMKASLIISQYIETNSGSTPKGVELWNVSGSTIDFSSNNLVIKKGTNGATPTTDYTLSSGTLFSGGVIVVGTSGDLATETTNNGGTHYTESFTFNGDDALEIYLGGTLTDMFGVSGSDPGSSWSGSGVSTANQNIQLKAGIWSGDTDGWTDPSTRFETVSTTPVSDMTGFGIAPGVLISGNAGFRMMSSPVSGQIYGDLLAELWIQGMTGGDVTDGTANVWTLNVSGQSWSALTNLSTASLNAGEGFLVYVFADTDWDGTDNLPVSLSVSGTENSSSASISSISSGNYALAGNPYATTIDWDLVTKTNLSGTTSVWDDASSGWKSWNGSSGSLTNGLIAPFQGFWIEASGGTGSMTIETADKSTSSGAFYRTMDDSTGSVSFIVTTQDYTDQTFMSFMASGEAGLDNADGRKLLPLQASPRVVGLSYAEETGLDIHNLPFENDGTISFPLDVMLLSLNESNYVTEVGDVTLSWNLDELPDHVDLTLIDNFTNTETDLSLVNTLTFSTEPKGSFSAVPDGPVGPYPVVGDPRFMLTVTYGALTHESQPTLPEDYRLHAIYPNPFNPRTMISFDLPRMSHTTIDVYDVSGRHVDQLLSEPLTPGTHHYTWSPNDLSSGIYLIQLTTGTDQFTQKVTYIK
jgi:hypothetical protein